MAFSLFRHGEKYNSAKHKEFIVDTDEDFETLPGAAICAPGSTAYSIASGKKKMLNNAGVWVLMQASGGGSGGCALAMTDVSEEGM